MSYMPSQLIGAMIDSVSDDSAFVEFSAKLATFAKTANAQIQIHTPTGAETISSHGISETLLKNYNEYFWRHDLWAIGYEALGFNIITPSEAYLRDDVFQRSEIYNDLLRPENNIVRCLGFTEKLVGGSTLLLGMHRTKAQSHFEADLVSAMSALHPQIVHLVEARRRIAAGQGRIAEHLIDADADATMVVSRNGELKFANQSAKCLLEAKTLLAAAGGRLTSQDPSLATWLRVRIADVVSGRGGGVKSLVNDQGARYRISVDRLEGTSGHLTCVRIRDEQAALRLKVDTAQTKFGFTIAEAQLAHALLDGASPAEHAIARGVKMSTVRSQLRSLFAKTGVDGQSGLLIALNYD